LLDAIDAANVELLCMASPTRRGQGPGSDRGQSSGVISFLRTAFTDAPPPAVKPRKEQIERDFALFAGKVNYVRTYRTLTAARSWPEIAARQRIEARSGRLDRTAPAKPSSSSARGESRSTPRRRGR